MNIDKLTLPLPRTILLVGCVVTCTATVVAFQLNTQNALAELRGEVRSGWTREQQHLFAVTLQHENPAMKVPRTEDIIRTYEALKSQR